MTARSLRLSLLSGILLMPSPVHAMRAIMEGLEATNNTVFVDTVNAIVQVKNLNRTYVSIKNSNPLACTGSGNDDGPILTALDTSTVEGYLLIDSSNCYINSSAWISNALYFSPGSLLTIAGGQTLTLGKNVVAYPQQIFAGLGNVAISTPTASVLPEWWGAKVGPVIAGGLVDSANAFQAADRALVNGGQIQAGQGVYLIGSSITFNNAGMSGYGWYTTNGGTLFLPSNTFAVTTLPLFTLNTQNTKYNNFMIAANVDPSSYTAITTGTGYGADTLEDIYVKIVGIGLWLKTDNGSHIQNFLGVSCSSICIYEGGVSGEHVGDTHWRDITAEPKSTANGWIQDMNVSATYLSHFVELGGINGFWVRGATGTVGGSDIIPSNLNIDDISVINANSGCGIRFDANLDAKIAGNTTINGNGTNLCVYSSSHAYVDGIILENVFMDGATGSNVDFSSGTGLIINGGQYFNSGVSSASIHIGVNTSGLVSITNAMIGLNGEFGYTPNSGLEAVLLDTGSLANTLNAGGSQLTGTLVLSNNIIAGGSKAAYEDFSVAASTNKFINSNYTGLTPTYSYSNNAMAGVFGSSVTLRDELTVGTTATLAQSNEKGRFRSGVDNNLVVAGGQHFSTGGTVLGLTDANALAPLQLRGTEVDSLDGPVRATAFTDTSSRSIFGNFVGSNTVTSGSSVTVTLSGYTQYRVKLMLNNATGATGTVFVRFSFDGTTDYSYSSNGWQLSVATGSSCGNVAASAFALTTTGASNAANNFNSTVEFSADFNIGTRGNNQIEGVSKYQETTANSIVNLSFGGYQNSGTLNSIQAWVGKSNSCTSITDPTTGTTGSMWVWGVY